MRSRSELEAVKNFVESVYSNYHNLLIVNTEKPYDPLHSELGYSYKYTDTQTGNSVYKVVCSKLGIPRTDFRVMIHEYGHVYLGHLDGIYEELDTQICNVFRDHRGELIDHINKSCGIDFADKLIERVIDDPVLNHSLHNIAMDMEVNSSILSTEDIEEMEKDISSVMPKYEEEMLGYMIDHTNDEEKKKALQDKLDQMLKEAKIKLILPCRYVLEVDDQGKPVPFPDGLTYGEYLMLIIERLDQFVKMLVSIKMGGNGDTSQITQRDIQNALNNMKRNWANKSDEYKQGYNDALNDYKNNQTGKSLDQHKQQQSSSNQQNGQQQDQNSQGLPGQGNPTQQGDGQGQPMPGNSQGNASGNSNSGQGQSQNQGQGSYEDGYNDALNDIAQGQGQGSGMQGLSDLLNDLGMSDGGEDSNGQSGQGHKYKGTRKDYDSDDGKNGNFKDHRTQSRDEADKKRELGQIRAGGGVGCGDSGGPDATRVVNKDVDEVEMALREVITNMRSKVIKQDTKKDIMRLYNRGIVRSVIAPTVSRKVTLSTQIKIAYLIDISGSMDTALVDRILSTIAISMKKLQRGLKYDIITWSTRLGEHIKDVDPMKSVPRISMGGGTSIAGGIQYFKDHYDKDTILVVISDFEDYLEEWHDVEKNMPGYSMWGFNYGDGSYNNSDDIPWSYMKVRKFNKRR